MSLPNIIPWEPSHVPAELQSELNRRKQNISLNYVPIHGTWDNGDWKKYTGPMTSWVRVCSNGRGRPEENTSNIGENLKPPSLQGENTNNMNLAWSPNRFRKKRFVFFGGKDFESTYGFKHTHTSPNSQIIGYMPNGIPHIIDNSRTAEYPIHVPAPEITRVEMTIQKELLRRATIEWVCFSWKQLEYMTPYFLVPGITCMIEMGWNHFNPVSLVDIENDAQMQSLWDNPYPLYEKNIIDSKGNYDVIYGMITNFNWSVDGNNRYTCTTEITSKNRLYAGLPVNSELYVRTLGTKDKNEPAKTMGNLSEFLNSTQLIQNFRSVAREGIIKFLKRNAIVMPAEKISVPVNIPVLALAEGLFPDVFRNADRLGIDIRQEKAKNTKDQKPPIMPLSLSVDSITIPATIDATFFKDVYDRTLSIKDEEKRQLKLSYLYGVFDGRDGTETNKGKTPSKNQSDFDQGSADDGNVWFSMGLLSTLINVFSDRASVSAKESMFELDIDDVLIGAHPNLISANGGVMLVPNPESPKFFWGRRGKYNAYGLDREAIAKNKKDYQPDYSNQYVEGVDSNRPADILLKRILDQKLPARDDIDIWINRNVYRMNPQRIQSDEDPNYKAPHVNSRSFPNRSINEPKPCGYLHDIYFNMARFKEIIKNPNIKSYYDLVQKIIRELNEASAGFWDLQMSDNGMGKWTIMDYNFVSARNGKKGNVLVFDMHDANNIVKSFKFRPQMTDAQTTRVLYSDIANRNSQFYSREEIESVNFKYKDSYIYNDADGYNKSYTAANLKFEEIWQNTLSKLQVIDQDASDTLQMKIQRDLYPNMETDDQPEKKFRYIKLALPSTNGASILKKLLDDEDYESNPKYSAIQPGIIAEITMQGLGGLRTFQCFLIKNLPEPYSHKDIIFQIINVMDHMESGNWETTIVAGIRPLRAYIKDVLSLNTPT